MKVGVITRHSVANYGSILQSYATQKIIEGIGHECEIIDYTKFEEQGKNKSKTLCKNSKIWNRNTITRLIYRIIQTPNYLYAYNKFKKYRSKLLKQTEIEYSSIDELRSNPPKADIYCSGSDQIWGKIGTNECDESYFLEFVPKGSKCISYAASIGKENVPEEIKKCIRNFLPKYSKVLVREKSAVDIIKKEGISNVEQVLDPTLLLNKTEWNQIANCATKVQKYVLVYQLHDNKKFVDYAKKFAKKVNLPLIRICPSVQSLVRGGKPVFLPTPQEFISYFKNAEYVVTDSFHGTVFSLIFNRKFIDILPNETSTRIVSILELTNLKNRILKNYEDFSLIEEEINYEMVNSIIQIEREKCIKKFKNAIEQ